MKYGGHDGPQQCIVSDMPRGSPDKSRVSWFNTLREYPRNKPGQGERNPPKSQTPSSFAYLEFGVTEVHRLATASAPKCVKSEKGVLSERVSLDELQCNDVIAPKLHNYPMM